MIETSEKIKKVQDVKQMEKLINQKSEQADGPPVDSIEEIEA